MIHGQYYTPSIQYGIAATVLSDKQLDKLQKPMIEVLLPTMGYNRHTPEAIRHGPKRLGGIGFVNLKTIHGTKKIASLIQQIRIGRPLGDTMMIALKWAQLHAGTATTILEDNKNLTYIDEPWIQTVIKTLQQSETTIYIPDLHTQPLR